MKRLLRPGTRIVLLLAVLATVCLVLAFRYDREDGPFSLFAYAFSTYALVIFVTALPGWIRRAGARGRRFGERITADHPHLQALTSHLGDYAARTRSILIISLCLNLAVAVFKLATGALYHSLWLVALGIYYGVLGLVRFFLLRSMTDAGAPGGDRVYRRTGALLFFLNLIMSGIFAQMVLMGRSTEYPGVLIYAMALWAFVKIISACVNLIRRRQEENRILAAARCVSFAAALMSILALQSAMLTRFGEGDVGFARMMNGISGAAVTVLLLILSIAMMDGRERATEE